MSWYMTEKQRNYISWRLDVRHTRDLLPEQLEPHRDITVNMSFNNLMNWVEENIKGEDIKKLFKIIEDLDEAEDDDPQPVLDFLESKGYNKYNN